MQVFSCPTGLVVVALGQQCRVVIDNLHLRGKALRYQQKVVKFIEFKGDRVTVVGQAGI